MSTEKSVCSIRAIISSGRTPDALARVENVRRELPYAYLFECRRKAILAEIVWRIWAPIVATDDRFSNFCKVAERTRDLIRIICAKTMEFKETNKQYRGPHIWARGYFVASGGNVTDEVIAAYVANQDEQEKFKSDNYKISGL